MPQNKKVTMKDIAEKLDVSIVTVSKALAGKEGVGDKLREEIKDVAVQLGYVFKKNTDTEMVNKNIGVLIAERFVGDGSFYLSIYQKLLLEMTQRGMIGILEVIRDDDEKSGNLPSLISLSTVEHLIVLGEMKKPFLESLDRSGKNVILFDFENEDYDFDAVVGDNVNGGYLMTRYLYKQGITDLAFVGNFKSTRSILDRYLGFRKYHIIKDHRFDEDNVVMDRLDDGTHIDIKLPERMPQGFVCNCDVTAVKLIKVLRENGYRVPEDIAVVGYDDFAGATNENYGLTTYRVNTEEMIYQCINIIEQRLQNPDYRHGTSVSYGRLIERKTGLKNITK
ncbi:MAG: LacI family DNA-binding transcriptional regulator [Eubacterium sp.]|nr:LacI family DNA-binding transcriptional regulator [Eubacterium sp.]